MTEKKFDIPESGSLGLLATGYVGLMAWRRKKAEVAAERKMKKSLTDNKKKGK